MVSGAFLSCRAGVGRGRERETLTKISSGIKMMIANFDSMTVRLHSLPLGAGSICRGRGRGSKNRS